MERKKRTFVSITSALFILGSNVALCGNYFFRPSAHGISDGSSWTNAKAATYANIAPLFQAGNNIYIATSSSGTTINITTPLLGSVTGGTFYIQGGFNDATVSGVNVSSGYNPSIYVVKFDGGGSSQIIGSTSGTTNITVIGLTFSNGASANNGGGVYLANGGTVTANFYEDNFLSNTLDKSDAVGGSLGFLNINSGSSITINHDYFNMIDGSDGYGGAIGIEGGTDPGNNATNKNININITNSSFTGSGNSSDKDANFSAGIYIGNITPSGSNTVSISNSGFCSLSADKDPGAAIYLFDVSGAVMNTVSSFNNAADGNTSEASVDIYSSTTGNTISNSKTQMTPTAANYPNFTLSGNSKSISANCPTYAQILPVTFTRFIATAEESEVQLLWTIATESNNKGFTVERSVDEIHFEQIAFINTKAENGNSNALLNYSFTDMHPATGVNFYRLAQTDIDDKITYSTIVSATIIAGKNFTMIVYPNPVTNNTKLVISGINNFNNAGIVITNAIGEILARKTITQPVNDINFIALPSGIYFIKYTDANGNSGVLKIIK